MLIILRYSTKHANFAAFSGRRCSTPLIWLLLLFLWQMACSNIRFGQGVTQEVGMVSMWSWRYMLDETNMSLFPYLPTSVPSKAVCCKIGPALWKISSTDFVKMSKWVKKKMLFIDNLATFWLELIILAQETLKRRRGNTATFTRIGCFQEKSNAEPLKCSGGEIITMSTGAITNGLMHVCVYQFCITLYNHYVCLCSSIAL